MRLLRSTEQIVVKDKNGDNSPNLEMVAVTLSITIINKHQKFYFRLYPIKNLGN